MKLLFLVFIFTSSQIFAQNDKIEAEQRIKKIEVPDNSIAWLNASFPNLKKVKWYSETTSHIKSFEAKFKLNKINYSVEFSQNGLIEDVEIERKLSELTNQARENLTSSFQQFEKFKLTKIQEQWTSDASEKLSQALISKDPSSITIKYEVEFSAVIEGSYALWEGLFDANGLLLNVRKIKLRATDNLDY
uniref:hypothetical protein n=1 Tax=Roseivirga sp. TaxID=1964215 RepID=UPI004048C90E